MADSEIGEAGAGRFALRLGGRFGLVRWHREETPDRGWQLDFEGGFFGHFDMTESLDNIGWDGLFGPYLSRLPSPDLGFRFGIKHRSSRYRLALEAGTGPSALGELSFEDETWIGVGWYFDF